MRSITSLRNLAILTFIVGLSLIMHLRVFKLDLISMHVWRQTETQTVIQNFVRDDMNIFNPRFNNLGDSDGIFRKEFPLMQWIIALAAKVFTESVLLTRIMMFLLSMLTVLGFYRLGRVFFADTENTPGPASSTLTTFSKLLPFLPAFFIAFSPTFFFFSVNPIPDIFALMCLSWGLYYFFIWERTDKARPFVLALMFLMLGSLVKLPFLLFYSLFLLPFVSDCRAKSLKHLLAKWSPVLLSVIPVLAWYLWVIPGWEANGIVRGIAAVKGPEAWKLYFTYLQHNLISTLPELLTGYAGLPLFLCGIFFAFYNRIFHSRRFLILLAPFILFVLYFLFELNMIGEAHDYYLFPFYPFIALLIVYGFREIVYRNRRLAAFAMVLFVLMPVASHLRLKDRWNIQKPGFNKDLLVYRDELRASVPPGALCIAGSDASTFIMLYYIDKKGWTYDYASLLPRETLEEMIGKGAGYLYSDMREVDESPAITPFFEEQVAQYGSIRVMRLKSPESVHR